MTLPWNTLAEVRTPDGCLKLLRRAERDWLITLDGRVLMNSASSRSEVALGALACTGLRSVAHPRVLLGGLGMGYTLRAVLDALPRGARVDVAELNPVVVEWCRGPIAHLSQNALTDARVRVVIENFSVALERAARKPGALDAVVIDLYVGPDADTRPDDPLYGSRALRNAHDALRTGGTFAVWGENHHKGFERRLSACGFEVTRHNPARGSGRMVVYLAVRQGKPGEK